jgi:large subunit ribosomal protein L24
MPGVDIRKDDTVKVIAGKDLGHQGRVVHVDPRKGRVLVEGAARAKKHTRTGSKRSTSGQSLQQGGIIDMEQMIDISNVQVVCKTCNKSTRVAHRVDDDGHKARVCKQCGADL